MEKNDNTDMKSKTCRMPLKFSCSSGVKAAAYLHVRRAVLQFSVDIQTTRQNVNWILFLQHANPLAHT